MVVIDTHLARGASNSGLTFHDRGGPYGRTKGARRVVAVDVTGLPVAALECLPQPTNRANAVERTVRRPLAHTSLVIYAVYGRWEKGSALQPTELEQVSATFRPDTDGVCVWTEAEELSVLRVSVDVEATSYEEAILLGQAALVEAAESASLPGHPTEVLATTDEGHAAWRS